jgi:hypothetical protein
VWNSRARRRGLPADRDRRALGPGPGLHRLVRHLRHRRRPVVVCLSVQGGMAGSPWDCHPAGAPRAGKVWPMNPVHPKKLLLTQWTAAEPVAKQKHFVVTQVVEPESAEVPAALAAAEPRTRQDVQALSPAARPGAGSAERRPPPRSSGSRSRRSSATRCAASSGANCVTRACGARAGSDSSRLKFGGSSVARPGA